MPSSKEKEKSKAYRKAVGGSNRRRKEKKEPHASTKNGLMGEFRTLKASQDCQIKKTF